MDISLKLCAVLTLSVLLTACDKLPQSTQTKTNQKNSVEIYSLPGDWAKSGKETVQNTMEELNKNAKNGDIIVFLPRSWGNEQLPLYFVNMFCNTNYQVIMNKAGVVCTYTDIRLKAWYENYQKSNQ
ncbi:MAG: hypothetical protein IJR44_02190 [Neisseriaceae bacterium]|nr:hypothetical protein [Neisseriaceae bacterium]